MLRWLKKLLRLHPVDGSRQHAKGAIQSGEAACTAREHVLLTRRCSHPTAEVAGFPEMYYCTECTDYFVLAWHPKISPFVESCEAVPWDALPAGDTEVDHLCIFCPACRTRFDRYGNVPWPGQLPRPMTVRECLTVVYPIGTADSPTEGEPIHLAKLRVDKIVVVISGELPPDFEMAPFIDSFVRDALRGDLSPDPAAGGMPIHVVLVDQICDETPVVLAMLADSVDKGTGTSSEICMTGPVTPLRPPLEQIMMCLVQPVSL